MDKVVEIFENVRDIPYYALEKRDPQKLMQEGRGSCLEKNVFLARRYEGIGIPVRYFLIDFDWRNLPIPEEIISKRSDFFSKHLAIKIKKERWIWVDSTWDSKLEIAGFPLTRQWDGNTDTKLAVRPLDKKEIKSPPDGMVIKKNQKFFSALNKYLHEVRENARRS